jgi:hypothetical protein
MDWSPIGRRVPRDWGWKKEKQEEYDYGKELFFCRLCEQIGLAMVKAARSWREKGVDGGIGRVQRKGGGDEES